MALSKSFLVLLQVFGLTVIVCAQVNDYCQTPRSEQGECKVISQCSVLLAILQKKPIRNQDVDYLRRSQCGFEGTLPKVCCPLNSGGSETISPVNENTDNEDTTNYDLLPNADSCGLGTDNRIYGGKEASLGEYPWMVLIEYERENGKRGFYCGGVLINNRYVLTAAHCVKGKDLPRSWKLVSVRLGEHNLDTDIDCEDNGFKSVCAPSPQNIPVEERIAHESYVPEDPNQYNDIAILRLSREVKYSAYVQAICLPKTSVTRSKNFVGSNLTVAGWGKTEVRSESPIKLKLDVPVKPNSQCVKTYRRANVNLNDGQLCAGGEKGKDSCRGDSGGPLMSLTPDGKGEIAWFSVGVVSFGPSPCGMEEWPGVYTRVAKYVPWIASKLRP